MLFATLLAVAQVFSPIPPSPGRQEPFSVLLVIADDIGQEPAGTDWSAYPPLLSTSLGQLAARGVTFTRAYSWPICCPTRFAVEYGRYPRRASVDRVGAPNPVGFGNINLNAHSPTADRVLLELVAMPEVLGLTHRTFLTGKHHLGRAPGIGTMNHTTSAPPSTGYQTRRGVNYTAPAAGPLATGYYGWLRDNDGLLTLSSQYATNVQRNELIGDGGAIAGWWPSTPGPKFAVFSPSEAHEPLTDENAPPGFVGTGDERLNYEQHVAYLDLVLQQVLDVIDLDTTYVVFVGDNGTVDAARPPGTPSGVWKGSVREGGVRVPLIVAGPGIVAGTSARLVSVADIPATLFELVGACPGSGFEDSLSFADELGPSWTGSAARTFVFTERYEVMNLPPPPQPIGYDGIAIVEDTTSFAGRTARWKLIREDVDGNGPGTITDTLYNLKNDPWELNPISPATPGVAAVYARLLGHLASVPARAQ